MRKSFKVLWSRYKNAAAVRGLLQWIGLWNTLVGWGRTLLAFLSATLLSLWARFKGLAAPLSILFLLVAWAVMLYILGKIKPRLDTSIEVSPTQSEPPAVEYIEDPPRGLHYVGWFSGSTFGIPRMDGGTCSVLEVTNNVVDIPVFAKDATARIEYWNAAGTKRFVVPVATWWCMIPGRARGSGGWRYTVDVEAGTSQCLVLFASKGNQNIVYRDNTIPAGVIDYGKWAILIQVSSENLEGFEITLSFTITRSGMQDIAFDGVHRRIPPRSRAASKS